MCSLKLILNLHTHIVIGWPPLTVMLWPRCDDAYIERMFINSWITIFGSNKIDRYMNQIVSMNVWILDMEYNKLWYAWAYYLHSTTVCIGAIHCVWRHSVAYELNYLLKVFCCVSLLFLQSLYLSFYGKDFFFHLFLHLFTCFSMYICQARITA